MRRLVVALMLGWLILPGCAMPVGQQRTVVPKPKETPGFHGDWQARPFDMPEEILTDTAGQAYNLSTSPSRPVRLVYFGYIDCPDTCVTVMADLAAAKQRLDPSVRGDIEVLFIDIAPEHDHPAKLRSWLDRFDPASVGLLGSHDQIGRIADRLGVPIHHDDEHGLVHGAQVIGFDRSGQGVIVWPVGITVEQLTEDLTQLAARQR